MILEDGIAERRSDCSPFDLMKTEQAKLVKPYHNNACCEADELSKKKGDQMLQSDPHIETGDTCLKGKFTQN